MKIKCEMMTSDGLIPQTKPRSNKPFLRSKTSRKTDKANGFTVKKVI